MFLIYSYLEIFPVRPAYNLFEKVTVTYVENLIMDSYRCLGRYGLHKSKQIT